MAYWFLAGGALLLILGSEAVIRGGVGTARALGLPPLLIGVFVISIATSTPELFVSVRAATTGSPGIALGDIVGGNILNLLLVLGLGALIHPMVSPPKVVLRDGGAMLLAGIGLAFLTFGGVISRRDGLILLLAAAAYLAVVVISDWRRTCDHSVAMASALGRSKAEPPPIVGGLFLFLIGLILLALGANFTVAGSVALARELNLQEAFVGLTVVAASTSLPILIGTFAAATRGHAGVAVGQLIGANVVNLLFVLGITAAIEPLSVPSTLASVDIYVMAVASAAVLPLLAMRWRLSRPRGFFLMAAYGCYLLFLVTRQGLFAHLLPWIG